MQKGHRVKKRNKFSSGTWRIKIREVLLKPVFLGGVYAVSRLLRWTLIGRYIPYTAKVWVESTREAVSHKSNYFVKWFYPLAVQTWVLAHAHDHAYNMFREKAEIIYFDRMLKEKNPRYKHIWRRLK